MNVRIAFFFCCALALAACQPVVLQQPIGTPVTEDLSSTFDGMWQTEDGHYVFSVKAQPNGLLKVAGIEWRGDRFAVRDTTCLITRLGGWTYLNIPLPKDTAGRTLYLFAPFSISSNGEFLTAFPPSASYVQEDAKKGHLTVSGKLGVLGHLEAAPSEAAYFETHAGELIRTSDPIVLKRTRRSAVKDAWPMEK